MSAPETGPKTGSRDATRRAGAGAEPLAKARPAGRAGATLLAALLATGLPARAPAFIKSRPRPPPPPTEPPPAVEGEELAEIVEARERIRAAVAASEDKIVDLLDRVGARRGKVDTTRREFARRAGFLTALSAAIESKFVAWTPDWGPALPDRVLRFYDYPQRRHKEALERLEKLDAEREEAVERTRNRLRDYRRTDLNPYEAADRWRWVQKYREFEREIPRGVWRFFEHPEMTAYLVAPGVSDASLARPLDELEAEWRYLLEDIAYELSAAGEDLGAAGADPAAFGRRERAIERLAQTEAETLAAAVVAGRPDPLGAWPAELRPEALETRLGEVERLTRAAGAPLRDATAARDRLVATWPEVLDRSLISGVATAISRLRTADPGAATRAAADFDRDLEAAATAAAAALARAKAPPGPPDAAVRELAALEAAAAGLRGRTGPEVRREIAAIRARLAPLKRLAGIGDSGAGN